jgi:hypothetical protein
MTQMGSLSPNALRLLGRLHRHKKAFGIERLRYDCKDQFDGQDPAEVADELVVHGYFDCSVNRGRRVWCRTDKPYTDKLRMKLAAYAQRHKEMHQGGKRERQLNELRQDIDPFEAKLFPQHPVFIRGRVHYMEGGSND